MNQGALALVGQQAKEEAREVEGRAAIRPAVWHLRRTPLSSRFLPTAWGGVPGLRPEPRPCGFNPYEKY